MVITLTGNNVFALRQRLDELTSKFISEHGDLALERIDGSDSSFRAVLETVQSLPFLAPKKMVVLRDAGANKDIAENIEQIISASGDSTDLVIYDSEPDKRTAYFKTLQKHTQIESFSEMDAPGLGRWLVEEAQRQGGELNIANASYLVERLGADQQLLSRELDKLLLYNPKISRDDIELLTESTPQSKIFELLDAAFGGNKERALRLYEEQRIQKVEPQAIMAMLIWQLSLLATVKLGSSRSEATIAADTGMKPYPISKAAGLADKLGGAKLKAMVSDLFQIDWQSKTSSLDLDEALKTYIVTL